MLYCTICSLAPLPQRGQVKDFFPEDSSLIIRRGQSFKLELLTSPISGCYQILISFASFYNPGTTYGEYSTLGNSHNSRHLVLEVKIPSSFPIGKFALSVKLLIKGDSEVRFAFVSPNLIVLFNPYFHDDVTYHSDSHALRSYYREDDGVIIRGSRESPEEFPWEYAQYSEPCLEAAMRMVSVMDPTAAADVIKVSQQLTSRVNPFNRDGIFKESYAPPPLASVSPAQWNSSLPLFKRFLAGKYPPLPGECWTMAGVLVSLLRCVGIPARPVTCYNAAHQCKKLGRTDSLSVSDTNSLRYFIHQVGLVDSLNKDFAWVYHVWVEAWLSSDSAPGWHVLDPSSNQQVSGPFRTGPIAVSSVANYHTLRHTDHSVECVAGETNYSCYTFRVMEISVLANCWKYSLVKIEDNPGMSHVVTMDDTHTLQDITDSYKIEFQATSKHSEDLSFETYMESDSLDLGAALKFGIRVENLSDFCQQFEGMVAADSILYTLIKISHISDFHFSGSLAPHKSKEFNFVLKYHEYFPHLQHQGFIRLLYQALTTENSTSQTFLTSSYVRVKSADLALFIKAPEEVKLNAQYRVKISFRNPIQTSLTHVTIHVNSYWLMKEPQELKHRRSVKPDEEISVIAKLHPTCVGAHKLYVTLTAVQLSNVYATKTISVIRV